MRIVVERRQALDADYNRVFIFVRNEYPVFFCILHPSVREPSACLQMALVFLWMRPVMLFLFSFQLAPVRAVRPGREIGIHYLVRIS